MIIKGKERRNWNGEAVRRILKSQGSAIDRALKMSVGELACTYAALILHDDGISVTTAKVNVESYWPSLFANLCEKKNIEDLLLTAGSGGASFGGSVAVTVPPFTWEDLPPNATASAPETKPEDDESDDEYMTNLFD